MTLEDLLYGLIGQSAPSHKLPTNPALLREILARNAGGGRTQIPAPSSSTSTKPNKTRAVPTPKLKPELPSIPSTVAASPSPYRRVANAYPSVSSPVASPVQPQASNPAFPMGLTTPVPPEGNSFGSYFNGKPFSPTPGPGQPGAPPGPNLGGSALNLVGRLNNSFNPISLLLGLTGMNQPPDEYRPIWKGTNKSKSKGTLPDNTPQDVQGP